MGLEALSANTMATVEGQWVLEELQAAETGEGPVESFGIWLSFIQHSFYLILDILQPLQLRSSLVQLSLYLVKFFSQALKLIWEICLHRLQSFKCFFKHIYIFFRFKKLKFNAVVFIFPLLNLRILIFVFLD